MVEEAFFIQNQDASVLKKVLAKILYKKKTDQIKIAEILDLSQPMVSNYVHSNEEIPSNIQKIAEKIAEKISKDTSIFFQTSIILTDKKIFGNYYIADETEIISDEKNKIIQNLSEAFQILKGTEISKILPEVKINIAMAKTTAKHSNDVASFANGLIVADDKIVGYNGIRFGKSKHLSSLIIKHKNSLNFNAVMNIAYVKEIEQTTLSIGFLTKNFELKNPDNNYDLLIHKGDFGIEPCAYILGKNAVDVTGKLLKIVE